MAKVELMDDGRSSAIANTGDFDVLVCVTGEVDPLNLSDAANHAKASLPGASAGARIAIARIDADESNSEHGGQSLLGGVRLLSYKPGNNSGGASSILPSGAVYSSLFALARSVGAKATAIVGADMAALEQGAVASLIAPILAGDCELAMPVYTQSRFSGLLNAGILSPVARALYGKRVRYPLAQDFAIAATILPVFERGRQRPQHGGDSLFWPATEAAVHDRKICQVPLTIHRETVAEGVDLGTVLSQIVGPLFADMEPNAPVWQRVRASQALPSSGAPYPVAPENGNIDPRPMIESFLLASRNLQEVWSLVLPPVTQLDLKRLARATVEQFHLPDALWVRIVYDFALAHRLRTLSRSHLMGALKPLYLAWVASYVGEVSLLSDADADARVEQLALAFETGKPYLQSRWRWPDRFNP